jgi:non-ribosomal peptide synthetase component E (peptide arylation enzyme)
MAGQATLAELITDVARQQGDKAALIFQDQPISYAQLDALVESNAARVFGW